MKLALWISLFALVNATAAFGKETEEKSLCVDPALSSAETLDKAGVNFPLVRAYCYTDSSGAYVLYLSGAYDQAFPDNENLSSAVNVQIFKLNPDKSLTAQARIHDVYKPQEAGIRFETAQTELLDLNDDGLIDPVVVYRFMARESNAIDYDQFSGRMTVVTFYKGQKVIINAITGSEDRDRKTVASANFFTLPLAIKQHLIYKMKNMYDNDDFGFDNSHNFMPRRMPHTLAHSENPKH